jgi:hypothetical protein
MNSIHTFSARRPAPACVRALVTQIVLQKRSRLLEGHVLPVICARALPLDPKDPRPLQSALRRNLEAAWARFEANFA